MNDLIQEEVSTKEEIKIRVGIVGTSTSNS